MGKGRQGRDSNNRPYESPERFRTQALYSVLLLALISSGTFFCNTFSQAPLFSFKFSSTPDESAAGKSANIKEFSNAGVKTLITSPPHHAAPLAAWEQLRGTPSLISQPEVLIFRILPPLSPHGVTQ
ncbi:hypothetical protein E2C01_032978 [Portunus trituberculatus]|uniref:Uncharacterized protein n=1 Tax=Portunus trituberculatus TaxID=210409 RepID=A0A5B7EYX2_PORTR|nr:hypothetical protein [Portunus trituberculatus]